MAKKAVVPDKYIINPRFPIPDGLVGYEYAGGAPGNNLPAEGDALDTIPDDVFLTMPEAFEEEQALPPIPDDLTIISQTVRTDVAGGQVIDVVVEVPDIPNYEFDFRVSK